MSQALEQSLNEAVDAVAAWAVPLESAIERGRAALLSAFAPVIELLDDEERVQSALARLNRLAKGIELIQATPSPGYGPVLERLGRSPEEARFVAFSMRAVAEQTARNRNVHLRAFIKACRRLAVSEVGSPAAPDLLEVIEANGTGLEALPGDVDAALLDRLAELLTNARAGDQVALQDLMALAKALVPLLPSPRGRPQNPSSIAHAFFLETLRDMGEARSYTSSSYGDRVDFTDEATKATRAEYNQPRFDPRRVVVRLRGTE